MAASDKTNGTVVPLTRDNALSVFTSMLAQVPDAPESDGSEILMRILESDDIDQAGTQTGLPAAKDLIGRHLMVDAIEKRPADQGMDGLPFYLVVDGHDRRTGEVVRFQTSAVSITAWLVKLYLGGALPAEIEIVASETRSGRTAVDCKIHASSGRPAKLTPTA